MTTDPTQQQSTEGQVRAQDLSRKRDRPPIDVSGYSPRQFIGAGAYGEVWVAVDQNTGRKVAIKFYIHRGGLDWSLLSSEVEKLVFLSADRYVVQLLDVGWDADPPYYVMEYVENGSLEDHLKRHGTMSVGDSVEMFRDIATGLVHAHGKGVLHCDLKPANILLDQDHKPRLADFGQSRLSHEQTPALGTLFYMAPEQASMDAVPDARWDVYALGAILYCMLTGESPHRSDDAVSEIDSAPALDDRLERYRNFIKDCPPLTAHREVAGVDRELVSVVDRCLAYDPEERFPNVQSVLDALRVRDTNRDRRPLLILGLLGPLLFLALAGFIGYRGHQQSVNKAEDLLRARALESNRFAAAFVAEAVARRFEGYFRAVEQVAADQDVITSIERLTAEGESAEWIRRMDDGDIGPTIRDQLYHDKDCNFLFDRLKNRLENGNQDIVVSWFITNDRGTQLASQFADGTNTTFGKNYAYRTYFTGLQDDLPKGSPPNQHVTRTQLSAVFQSEHSGTWKVAVSTPVWASTELNGAENEPPRFLGIVALTVELGGLGELLQAGSVKTQDGSTASQITRPTDHFNVLVAKDENDSATILQHPLFQKLKGEERVRVLSDLGTSKDYRVDLSNWRDDQLYVDPLSKHPSGASFANRWVAAKRDVTLPSRGEGSEEVDTGLAVIIQENYDNAVESVRNLGRSLSRLGAVATAGLIGIVVILWWFVVRAISDPNERRRKQSGSNSVVASLHSMETIELPKKLRRE
ncbi:MAG: protein kinase [Planctomycetales bacterium]|nr:protein kinase [Planctomycetales bacterium]